MTPTPEALTPEEREQMARLSQSTRLHHFEARPLQKLLRIHDQQAARIAELERENADLVHSCNAGPFGS